MSKGIEKLREEYNLIKKNDSLCELRGTANPINGDFFHWKASFIGPKETPYMDGLFILEMKFPQNYPYERPLVQMRTPIFHPNIDNQNGNICIDYIINWKKDYDINGIIHAVFLVLFEPNFMNSFASYSQLDKEAYFRKSIIMCRNYAVESQSYNWDTSWNKGWDI